MKLGDSASFGDHTATLAIHPEYEIYSCLTLTCSVCHHWTCYYIPLTIADHPHHWEPYVTQLGEHLIDLFPCVKTPQPLPSARSNNTKTSTATARKANR